MGRPRLWNTPEEFETVAGAYFDSCVDKDGDPVMPTINGLCLAIGCCRETLWDYSRKEGFSDAVKRVRSRLEMAWEKRLSGNSCTGAIFWLKNQGWVDKAEMKHSGDPDAPLIVRWQK